MRIEEAYIENLEEYIEKTVDYPELLDAQEFVEKHVEYIDVWKYQDPEENESVAGLYDFYLELCTDCEVDPIFTLEDFEETMRIYTIEIYEACNV